MTVFKFCCLLLIIYSLIFFQKLSFNNEVEFAGDAWHYQSLAVNFAKGFGLMKMGQLSDNYKFAAAIDSRNQPRFDFFVESGKANGFYSFYRTPGYIVFMGTLYKLFGVNPQIVKQVQLLLIIIIAAFLPYLGWLYWRYSGFWAGWLAGWAYLKEYARTTPRDYAISYPTDIMAEGLIAFGLFILLFMFIYWQKQKTPLRTISLGFIIALNLLIKGTNIFIPLLALIYLGKRHIFPYLLGLVIVLLPWSIYASKTAGKIVVLSTQSEDVLLDNNNEFTTDGGWHPEGFSYAGNTPVFYRQPEIKNLPLLAKLAAFFVAYPERIPQIFLAKIQLGFGGFPYLTLAIILIAVKIINQLTKNRLLIAGSIIAGGIMAYLRHQPALFNISRPLLRIDLILIGLGLLLALVKISSRQKLKLNIPQPLIIIFASYLLLALIVCGWPRINQVLDFIFMLIFFQYLIDLGGNLFKKSVKIIHHAF